MAKKSHKIEEKIKRRQTSGLYRAPHTACQGTPHIHRGAWGTFPNFKGNKMTSIRHRDNYPLNVLVLHPVVLPSTSDLYQARFSIVIKTKYVSGEDKYGIESEDAGVQI